MQKNGIKEKHGRMNLDVGQDDFSRRRFNREVNNK